MISLGLLAPEMPKNVPPTPPPEEPASSETARVATDLMEMMREICFNTRDTRGRRVKITTLLDGLLRPAVLKEYREFKRRQAAETRNAKEG